MDLNDESGRPAVLSSNDVGLIGLFWIYIVAVFKISWRSLTFQKFRFQANRQFLLDRLARDFAEVEASGIRVTGIHMHSAVFSWFRKYLTAEFDVSADSERIKWGILEHFGERWLQWITIYLRILIFSVFQKKGIFSGNR